MLLSDEDESMPLSFQVQPNRCVILILLAGVVSASCDGMERRRIHAENLVRAEQFKQDFAQHLAIGAPLSAVEEYLRTKSAKATRSLGFADGHTVVKELMIEVAVERSVNWNCGQESVGIIAEFADEHLKVFRVSSWSNDCF